MVSFHYFYWLVKQFKDFGVLDSMIEKIDLRALNEYYKPLFEKAKEITDKCGVKAKNADIRYVSNIDNDYLPVYEVRTEKKGIVTDIKLASLQTLINEIKKTEQDCFFRLNKNIAARVPYALEPKGATSLLVTVYMLRKPSDRTVSKIDTVNESEEESKLKGRESVLRKCIEEYEKQIKKCFEIDEQDRQKDIEDLMKDVLMLHRSIAAELNQSLDLLLGKIQAFVEEFASHLKDSENRTITLILMVFVYEMGASIWDSVTSNDVLRSYLVILDSLVDVSLKGENEQLLNNVVSVVFGIHTHLTILATVYTPDIRQVTRELKEIGIEKPLQYLELGLTNQENFSKIMSIVNSSIDRTMRNAVRFTYFLCKHEYTRTEAETYIYLEDNLKSFIDLLNPLQSKSDLTEYIKEKVGDHERNILRLAVYLFMQIENNIFPKEWLSKIVYPLAENCAPSDFRMDRHKTDEVINTTIHLSEFPSDEFETREMFSINPFFVYNSDMPLKYSPYKFWICFAIYRKKFFIDREYFPLSLKEDPSTIVIAGETIVNKLLEELSNLEVDVLATFCNLPIIEAEKERNLYVDYLQGLLRKNDEAMRKIGFPFAKGNISV